MADWYVTPAGAGAKDGTSLANAWAGFVNVVYGASGVDSGDVLHVSGDHTISSSGTSLKFVSQSYTAQTRAIGGTYRQATIPTYEYNIQIQDTNNVGIRNVDVNSSKARSILVRATGASDVDNIALLNIRVDNNDAPAGSATHALWITSSSTGKITNLIVRYALATRAGLANTNSNSDGINAEDLGANGTFEDIVAQNNHNEGLDISSGTSGLAVRRIKADGNGQNGVKVHCGTNAIDSAEVIAVASSNNSVLANQWGMAIQDLENSTIAQCSLQSPDGSPLGALQLDVANSARGGFTGNKFHNIIGIADYSAGVTRLQSSDAAESNATLADFEANNTWTHNCLWQNGASTTLFYFDDDTGNNVTEANHSTWVSTHTGDINVDPLMLDVANDDLRLDGDSPCIATGTEWWTAGTPTYGSELVTNGTFDSDTSGWSESIPGILSWQSGTARARITNDDIRPGSAFTTSAITVKNGTMYRFQCDGFIGTAGDWRVRVTDGVSTTYIDSTSDSDSSVDMTFCSSNTTVAIFFDTLATSLTGEYIEFDNVSLKEQTGGGSMEKAPHGEDGLRFMLPPSMGAYELRPQHVYIRKAQAQTVRFLPGGVDIAKARLV